MDNNVGHASKGNTYNTHNTHNTHTSHTSQHRREGSREESEVTALLRKGYTRAEAILIIAQADEAERVTDYRATDAVYTITTM